MVGLPHDTQGTVERARRDLYRRIREIVAEDMSRNYGHILSQTAGVKAAALPGGSVSAHEGTANPHPQYQIGPHTVTLHPPYLAASAAAANLAASTFSAVDDPSYRWMGDLRNAASVRIMGRIGGSLVAATKLRVQYHTGGDPAVASGDGGWTTLATTAGSHTLSTLFYSAQISVPSGAKVNNVLLRVGLYDGDGAADPTISACMLNLYP